MGQCCCGCHCSKSRDLEESSKLIRDRKNEQSSKRAHRSSLEERQRDAQLHHLSAGGAQNIHSLETTKSTTVPPTRNYSGLLKQPSGDSNEEERSHVLGLEESDSGVHSRGSPSSPKRSLSKGLSLTGGKQRIKSNRGKDLHNAIKQAYKLKSRYDEPSKEFLAEMDKLFMDVQMYLTELSARANTGKSSRKEADALVDELVALRNHWGEKLLPTSVCNAFVRERIQITVQHVSYRIDCAQFFEPVPFYSSSSTTAPTSGQLMKLYRFSVYEMSRNEVVMRYYLERSHVVQLYHVLCYSWGNRRGQVYPFGTECPTYWNIREQMVNDVCSRLENFF